MGFGKAGWVERKAGLWDFWHRWWLVLEPPPAEAPHEAGRLASPFSDLISKPRVCVSPASDPTCVCCLAAAAFCKPCIEGMWQQFMMRMSLIDGVDVQYEGAHHLP
jgi:hypothetical protein